MTTNQTIDGVPRATAERIHACLEAHRYAESTKLAKELRALLDANPEENVPCPQCGGSLRTWGCNCTPRWPMHKQRTPLDPPAAQPQGKPVEIGYIEHSKEFEFEHAPVINRLIWTMPPDQRHKIPQHYKVMLYAEQSAPVAVVMPERKTVDINDGALDNSRKRGYNACIDELKRLNPSLQSLPLQSQPL